MSASDAVTDPPPISRSEFVALMAMLSGTVAFSIDAMLPALPEIADATRAVANREQFVITTFIFGMGVGTLFTGALSDALGRRAVVIGGALIYCLAALVAATAQTLETILIARAVQGIGAAGPRVAAMSIVRDLFSGRQMAKIISFVMIVFALVPAIAPTLGAGIIALVGWRGIFVSFAVFSIISVTWLLLRLPETLPPEARRPFSLTAIREGLVDIAGRREVMVTILVQSMVFGILFGALAASQPIFQDVFDRADTFHLWFGGIALVSASGSFLNSQIVERLGMRRVITTTLIAQLVLSCVLAVLFGFDVLRGDVAFAAYIVWQTSIFFTAGLTIGNLNALALEPVGHIAGLAASIIAAVATILGALLAAPVSLFYDGSVVPSVITISVLAGIAVLLMRLVTSDA